MTLRRMTSLEPGSRVEPLRASPAVHVRLVRVESAAPGVRPWAEYETLGRVPVERGRLALDELTTPLRQVHARLTKGHGGLARFHDPAGFRLRAAEALVELGIPIRVAVDTKGRHYRPSGLFDLWSTGAPATRVRRVFFDSEPAPLGRHLDKHFSDPAELEGWSDAIRRAGLPFGRSALKEAARFAGRRPASDEPLAPEQWPLAECLAELTIHIFEKMTTECGMHCVRGARTSITIDMLLAAIGDSVLNIGPDEEALMAIHKTGLFSVARDAADPGRPLRWRTSYHASDREKRIQDELEAGRRVPEYEVFAWNP